MRTKRSHTASSPRGIGAEGPRADPSRGQEDYWQTLAGLGGTGVQTSPGGQGPEEPLYSQIRMQYTGSPPASSDTPQTPPPASARPHSVAQLTVSVVPVQLAEQKPFVAVSLIALQMLPSTQVSPGVSHAQG